MTSTKTNCWEHVKCQRQPGGALVGQAGPCPAATDTTCDGVNGGNNAGRLCWAIPGTLCEGKVQGDYSQKSSQCRECSFFRRVKYEEGCHFQLLTPGLGVSDKDVLHQRLNDIVKLVTMYRDIFACMAVGPLLERITSHALGITGCCSVGAYLLGDSPQKLSLDAGAGATALPAEVRLDDDSPVSAAIVNRSICRGTIALTGRTEAISVIAAPIGGERGPAGVLVLARDSGQFTIDDEWLLGELALLAGLGIGNSWLIESLRDLRGVDKAKSKAVSLLLHQIGSPLATIACCLTALLETEGSLGHGDRRKLLEYSLDRADSIAKLSTKLLDLAAIRSTGYLADVQPVCASQILREEVNARHEQARQAGLNIILRGDDPKALVQADPDGLRLIFANLLDNAIKYSAGKGKEIRVSLDTIADRLRISIRDEGIGIPRDEQDRLFEEFHRAPNAAASGTKGFGLGLAFVKELVGRYDGRINLDSDTGVGTTVTVELPLSTPPQGDEAKL